MALAMEWVSKVTTVALEMVLPGFFGQWLDGKWGTGFLGPTGFAFGVVVGMWHLLRMTKATGRQAGGVRMRGSSPLGKRLPADDKPPSDPKSL